MVSNSIDQIAVNKLLSLVLVLALVAGAFFLGNKFNLNEQSSQTTEEPTPTVSTQETKPKPVVVQKATGLEELLENGNFKKANEELDKVEEAKRDRSWKLNKIRSLEGLGETGAAIALVDSLMASANRAQKASLLWQKAEILIDSGEKVKAGDLYYEIFESYIDVSEGEKAAQKLKDLWKTWQNTRNVSPENLLKYNLVLSWVLQNSIDEGVMNDCYQILDRINAKIFYSPLKVAGLVDFHEVNYGENLSSIAKKYNVAPDRISRVNGLKSRNAIRAGQELRVIQGRVKMVVSKTRFNMDVYIGAYFFKRYPVGLGRGGNTPIVVTQVSRSMAKNPDYTNPDTGELVAASDPKNPIGTRWIGLQMGRGYGIHGTREPDSIGKESSNGCVRMLNENVEELYDFVMVSDEVEIK